MSPRVCQGLQSCLEPWPVQLRVFSHKLAPLNSNFSHSIPCHAMPTQHQSDTNNSNNNGADDCDSKSISDMGGWSFLQALGNPSHSQSSKGEAADEKEEVYVHPLEKQSSSTLSTKSLEMCTESLGSETGSDTGEGSYEFSSAPAQTQRYRSRELSKKMIRDGSIPPPLSSTGGVVLRPYREGGRLVIEAVSVPHRKACFQAERVDGRLRLSLLKGSPLDVEVAKDKVRDQVKAVDGEDEDGDDSHGGYWGDDIGGSSGNGGCEIEIEELPRPSRCKEDGSTRNKVMSNWGPSWVTIS